MSDVSPDSHGPDSASSGEYVVVARRYRPQTFTELVGQSQVSQALSNAISTHRIGHAYLFTGARGVGKTSTARIFAKALNCEHGPTPAPCNECDICQGIASGGDVDVLEIDGASNRGIDEIRQLRANINVRPSRARFKVYIIDEVHMLTTPAFNALLKTLEEPPEHAKFIFCTTDPEKIPITVLSRCQRFDFPPVEADAILGRLRFILESEHVEADDGALRLLARRANGSMRDSQSLLEQLLSFVNGRITSDDVHRMFGTARGGSLTAIGAKLFARDAAGTLQALAAAMGDGVDPGQLAEQLVGYFRDVMAVTVGCPAELLLHCQTADYAELKEAGTKFGIDSLLAAVQILDQAVARMRQSPHVRTLLEIALVRICQLEDLAELSQLIGQLRAGGTVSVNRTASGAPPSRPAPGASPIGSSSAVPSSTVPSGDSEKKKAVTAESVGVPDSLSVPSPAPSPTAKTVPFAPTTAIGLDAPVVSAELNPAPVEPAAATRTTPNAAGLPDPQTLWAQSLDLLEDMTADYARSAHQVRWAGPDRLVATFRAEYTLQKQSCERPDRKGKLEQALATVAGRPIQIDWELLPPTARGPAPRPTGVSRIQRLRDVERNPFVTQAKAVFDAEVIDVAESRGTEGT